MGSVEDIITVNIQEMVDFRWIGYSGCSLEHKKILDGIVRDIRRIVIPWWVKQTKRSVSLAGRHRATKSKIKILLWK